MTIDAAQQLPEIIGEWKQTDLCLYIASASLCPNMSEEIYVCNFTADTGTLNTQKRHSGKFVF